MIQSANITKIAVGNSCADAPASPCLGLSSTVELQHLGLRPAPQPAHSGLALTQEHAAAVPLTAAAALHAELVQTPLHPQYHVLIHLFVQGSMQQLKNT